MSRLNNLLKKQKQFEEMEKKLAKDKKNNKVKINSILQKKQEKENYQAGATLRKLFEEMKDFNIEKIEGICLKYFGEGKNRK